MSRCNPVLPIPPSLRRRQEFARRQALQEARNPVDAILHARSAGDLRLWYGDWVKGQSRSGKPVWTNQQTKERRYQEKEPGTGRAGKGKAATTQKGGKSAGKAQKKPVPKPQQKKPAAKKQPAQKQPRPPKVDHNEVGDQIQSLLDKGDFTDSDVAGLKEQLSGLTGAQLGELRKRFGLKGGLRTKEAMAGTLGKHVEAGRKQPAEKPTGKQPSRTRTRFFKPEDVEGLTEAETLAKARQKRQEQPARIGTPPSAVPGSPVQSPPLLPAPPAPKQGQKRPAVGKPLQPTDPKYLNKQVADLKNAKDAKDLTGRAKALARTADDAARNMTGPQFRRWAGQVLGRDVKKYGTTQELLGAVHAYFQSHVKHARAEQGSRKREGKRAEKRTQQSVDAFLDSLAQERLAEASAGGDYDAAMELATRQEVASKRKSPIEKANEARKAKRQAKQERIAREGYDEDEFLKELQGQEFSDEFADEDEFIKGLQATDIPEEKATAAARRRGRMASRKRLGEDEAQVGTPPSPTPGTPAYQPPRLPAPPRPAPRQRRGARVVEQAAQASNVNDVANMLQEPGVLDEVIAHTGYDPGYADQGRQVEAVAEHLFRQARKPKPRKRLDSARSPVRMILHARDATHVRPYLYAWTRKRSRSGNTVWVNTENKRDRRYQENEPGQRPSPHAGVNTVPVEEHLRRILEAPYDVADYYLQSLQTRLRRMKPGALAALERQFPAGD